MANKKVNIPDTKPQMQIIGKNNTLNVNLEVQDINIKGKDYKCRLVSVSKNEEFNPKWIDKVECYNWIYKFKVFKCEYKYILFYLGYENEITKTEPIK